MLAGRHHIVGVSLGKGQGFSTPAEIQMSSVQLWARWEWAGSFRAVELLLEQGGEGEVPLREGQEWYLPCTLRNWLDFSQ